MGDAHGRLNEYNWCGLTKLPYVYVWFGCRFRCRSICRSRCRSQATWTTLKRVSNPEVGARVRRSEDHGITEYIAEYCGFFNSAHFPLLSLRRVSHLYTCDNAMKFWHPYESLRWTTIGWLGNSPNVAPNGWLTIEWGIYIYIYICDFIGTMDTPHTPCIASS